MTAILFCLKFNLPWCCLPFVHVVLLVVLCVLLVVLCVLLQLSYMYC